MKKNTSYRLAKNLLKSENPDAALADLITSEEYSVEEKVEAIRLLVSALLSHKENDTPIPSLYPTKKNTLKTFKPVIIYSQE